MNLIWIAGIVFLLGSAVAIWPDAREQRRLVDETRTSPRVTGSHSASGSPSRPRVLLVALPFLREPVAGDDRLDAPTADEEAMLSLVEQRDRALAALKELEFDHRTGKITDDDYRRELGPLRQAAAAALRALDPQE